MSDARVAHLVIASGPGVQTGSQCPRAEHAEFCGTSDEKPGHFTWCARELAPRPHLPLGGWEQVSPLVKPAKRRLRQIGSKADLATVPEGLDPNTCPHTAHLCVVPSRL